MCAISAVRTLECWGANSFGQTGDGNPFRQSARPRPVPELAVATSVSAGNDFTCAIDGRGSPWCWGQNLSGQLGNGVKILPSLTPTKVIGGIHATALATGDFHACALETNGQVSCWGLGTFGQLGGGTIEDQNRPRTVSVLGSARAVAAGANHSCAVLADGDAACWGLNRFGQLGDGSRNDSKVPTRVRDIGGDAVRVVAGDDFTCALLGSGSVRCWGSNQFGQLGDGRRVDSTIPRAVDGIEHAVDLTAGGRHACAALDDGDVRCWGADESTQSGGPRSLDHRIPVKVAVAHGARQVAATDQQTCSVDVSGRVTCWGGTRR